MKGKRKGIVYARVSPRPDAENRSIEDQLSLCYAYCERHGIEVEAPFTDPLKSGGDRNRPGLIDAVAALKRGYVLVAENMDRVARGLLYQEVTIEVIHAKGASLETVEGTSTEPGEKATRKMIRQIVGAVNEFSRASNAERTSARMRQMQSSGVVVTRHAPFGTRKTPDGKRLVPCEDEQSVIAAVLELRKLGWGNRRIATHLAGVGVLNRVGKPIGPKLVQRILDRHDNDLRETEAVL